MRNPVPAWTGDEWLEAAADGYDNGTGFAGIAGELEVRFGSTVVFGYAGGCVNMVFDLETGHRVNITDAEAPYLTHIDERTADTGFTVGIYTADGFDNGEPKLLLSAYVDAGGLGDLIETAIRQLVTMQDCG